MRGRRAGAGGDPKRELRRAIDRARRRPGERKAVQIAGQPLMPEDYERWRRQTLGRGAILTAPDLGPRQYGLVLFAIDLESDEEFSHHDAAGLLTQPTVGAFGLDVEPLAALRSMLTDWLEAYPARVALAPPLLQMRGRWRLADMDLDWELEPNEQ